MSTSSKPSQREISSSQSDRAREWREIVPVFLATFLVIIKPQQAMGLSYFSTHISHLTVSKRSNTIAGTRSTRTLRRPFFRGRGARPPKAAPRTRTSKQQKHKTKTKGAVLLQGHTLFVVKVPFVRPSPFFSRTYYRTRANVISRARPIPSVRPSVRPRSRPRRRPPPPPGRSVSTFTTRRRRKSAALRPDTATSASPPPRSAARSTPR